MVASRCEGNGEKPTCVSLGMGMGLEAGACFIHVAVWEPNVTPMGWDGTSVWFRGGGKQWSIVGKAIGAERETTMGAQRETIMGNTWGLLEHGRYTPFFPFNAGVNFTTCFQIPDVWRFPQLQYRPLLWQHPNPNPKQARHPPTLHDSFYKNNKKGR